MKVVAFVVVWDRRMRPIMSWLPAAPDFRADLRVALESPDPTDCLERLASLAQYRLGYLETLQLDRALGRLTSGTGVRLYNSSACHPCFIDG